MLLYNIYNINIVLYKFISLYYVSTFYGCTKSRGLNDRRVNMLCLIYAPRVKGRSMIGLAVLVQINIGGTVCYGPDATPRYCSDHKVDYFLVTAVPEVFPLSTLVCQRLTRLV